MGTWIFDLDSLRLEGVRAPVHADRLVNPAQQLRCELAAHRDRGLTFARAWRRALANLDAAAPPGDDDLVFCNTVGSYLDHAALRRRFYRALEAAELPRVRFHDLRHHFGSGAITKLDAYAVQSYMGHQHYSTTQRYLHHRPRPQDAQRLHEAFGTRPHVADADEARI